MTDRPNGMLGRSGRFEKVACGRCEYLVANHQGGELSVRFKHTFVFVVGGLFVVNCTGCGAPNLLVDAEYEKLHPEEVARVRKSFDTFSNYGERRSYERTDEY